MKFARILAALLLSTSGLLPVVTEAATYYPANNYGSGHISRAEFVRLVMEQTGTLSYDGTYCFTDVKNQSYASYICAAKQQGIITGKPNGSFMPDTPISFIEAAAVVVRAEGAYVPATSPWYSGYLTQVSDWNAIPASVTNLLDMLTYGQAQELVSAAMHRDANDDDNNDDDNDSSSSDNNDNDDVDVRIDVSDATVEAGDRVTFRIRLENEENDDLENLDVRATLDDDMEFISASDDGDDDNDERVDWDNIDIDEDETKTLLLTIEVDNNADEGDTLRLKVKADDSTVTRSIRIVDDNDRDDNDEDVKISITDSSDPAEPGDTVTYKIRIENDGSDDIENLNVHSTLDSDMTFVSASDNGDKNGTYVDWDDIDIDEDEEVTLTLKVKIKTSVDDGDRVQLRVEADGDEDTEDTEIDDDADNDDNNDDDDNADIDISITDSRDTASVGDEITYRITLTNNENDDVSVQVRAQLDDGMSFLDATGNENRNSNDEVVWDDIEIDEDDERILLLTVRINNEADDGDTLRLEVEAGDGEDTETTRIND